MDFSLLQDYQTSLSQVGRIAVPHVPVYVYTSIFIHFFCPYFRHILIALVSVFVYLFVFLSIPEVVFIIVFVFLANLFEV